ncbi:hypothetical protein B0T26DRAFT_437730 [Lasiosphaeria miniovina]|uniref:Transcription factor domain-containing protein n=1 Tax=Lasiosphaeria miniovina TaxID=1954250 RepID=A0AA39ZYE6_9PEZI|nr:uncharacterized protein B0T26DRAFT_437730 [Lasiosphaeria miniovina]KAK0705885.1 hypothetical protein B0T26DRAFT_437730 [Lasiosphaeria miniovina]
MSSEAILWHQRCFWQLFMAERSFTLLRGKSIVPRTAIMLKKTLEPPTGRYLYESRDISLRFLQLVSLYLPLDEPSVTAWNGSSAPRVSPETNLAPQHHLAISPALTLQSPVAGYLLETVHTTDADVAASSESVEGAPANPPVDEHGHNCNTSNKQNRDGPQSSEPADIQTVNLLITQQWLRLIVWQSSLRQGLISWRARDKTLHFAFPLTIACRTASLLAALPRSAVQVPGTSIFEKIFQIGISCINFLDACDANLAKNGVSVTNVTARFLDGIEWRNGAVTIDPVELFVKALSSNPNSRTQFARDLRLFTSMRPLGMKITLTPLVLTPALRNRSGYTRAHLRMPPTLPAARGDNFGTGGVVRFQADEQMMGTSQDAEANIPFSTGRSSNVFGIPPPAPGAESNYVPTGGSSTAVGTPLPSLRPTQQMATTHSLPMNRGETEDREVEYGGGGGEATVFSPDVQQPVCWCGRYCLDHQPRPGDGAQMRYFPNTG